MRAEWGLWFLVTALLGLFIVWPVGSVFFESFFRDGHFSLRAYEGLFTKNIRLVTDSFSLALSVTLVTIPLSVLIALRDCLDRQLIGPDSTVMVAGFGTGLSLGSTILRYGRN